jgi:hypothetical protein
MKQSFLKKRLPEVGSEPGSSRFHLFYHLFNEAIFEIFSFFQTFIAKIFPIPSVLKLWPYDNFFSLEILLICQNLSAA